MVRAPLRALLVFVTFAAGCARTPTSDGTARVEKVVDGDTLEVSVAGTTETLRLLGIDTPETHHPTRPVECFGPEATARLAELVPPGTSISLERDVEPRDRFGRLLVYVRRDDGLDVNRTMVAEGYAAVLVIEPNGSRAATLREAEQAARGSGRGLWGACGEAHTGP